MNGHEVTVNGEPLDLYLNVRNHSPTGFAWGYGGSGPAQLALAILITEYGEDLEKHPVFYQEFKKHIIASLNKESFELSSNDVNDYVLNSHII